nr:MAG TPA: hypothetical protein [Caudoviricetes sp.]
MRRARHSKRRWGGAGCTSRTASTSVFSRAISGAAPTAATSGRWCGTISSSESANTKWRWWGRHRWRCGTPPRGLPHRLLRPRCAIGSPVSRTAGMARCRSRRWRR